MRHVDVAGAAGRFLADPDHGGAGRLREGASRLLADILEALDDNRLGGMAKSAIANRIRALEVSPLLGQSLEAAMAEGRHVPLLDGTYLVTLAIQSTDEGTIYDWRDQQYQFSVMNPSRTAGLVSLPLEVRFGTPYAERVEGSGS